jgi:hypothetical protein
MGRMFSAKPRPLYPRESDPEPTVQEDGWASEFVWTGAGYLASIEIRPPDILAVAH